MTRVLRRRYFILFGAGLGGGRRAAGRGRFRGRRGRRRRVAGRVAGLDQRRVRHERLRVLEHLAVERMVFGRDGHGRPAGLDDRPGRQRVQRRGALDQVTLRAVLVGAEVGERVLGRVRRQRRLRRQRRHGRMVVETVHVERRATGGRRRVVSGCGNKKIKQQQQKVNIIK